MLSSKTSPLGKVLSKYVRARIVSLEGVDIAHWKFDFHASIMYFMTNADEYIYARYGGRDSRAADSYLNLESLRLALAEGLAQHERYRAGKLPKRRRAKPMYPKDIPALERYVIKERGCVECHHIADYLAQHLESTGKLDKKRSMFAFPDIRNLGIELDVPKGLVVRNASGAAATAGMKGNDRIRAIEGVPVITFGDLQFQLDRVERDARQLKLEIERQGVRKQLALTLPKLWWNYDIGFRYWSIDPQLYFESRPLFPQEREALGLNGTALAAKVTAVDALAGMLKLHDLQVGDVIVGVNGVERDELVQDARLFMRLNVTPGKSADLSVIRATKRLKTKIKTRRQYYRKTVPEEDNGGH